MDAQSLSANHASDEDTIAMFADMVADLVQKEGCNGERLWRLLSGELLVGGVNIAREYGGLGGGAAESYAIMESLGRAPCWTPFLSSNILAGAVLRGAGAGVAAVHLAALAAGNEELALAYLEPGRRYAVAPENVTAQRDSSGTYRLKGRKTCIFGLANADYVIVSARGQDGAQFLFLVAADAAGVSIEDVDALDGTVGGNLALSDVLVPQEALLADGTGAEELLAYAVDEATVMLCAGACGTMRELIARTISYSRERHQFGQAIADFQVVKHLLVDMHVALEMASGLSRVALAKLASSKERRAEAVSGAKLLVSEALAQVSQGAVQLHGGIGVTDELPIGAFFKRALMMEHMFGAAADHLERYRLLSTNK